MTSMMWAAACNHESVISSLLANGADIEAEDEDGRTAVIWAIITDQKHTLLALLDNGADVEHPNKKTGRTPLLMAVADKNEALVDLLLQNDVHWLRSHFGPRYFSRFDQHRHRSAVSRGLHHAARHYMLIGVLSALLCPNCGFRPT